MSVLDILFTTVFNEVDADKIGINEGDFNCLFNKLVEYRDELNNACIVTSSFNTLIDIINNAHISYKTDDAYSNGNVIHVLDQSAFCNICGFKKDINVYHAWLSVIKDISWDIDTLEAQYNDKLAGQFLRSVLVYFTQFTIVTEIQ